MRKISLTFLFLAMALVGTACGWDKVEPGNVGILVDKGTGTITPIYETKWRWLGWYEELIEWPVGQQAYVMERGDSVGQIKGGTTPSSAELPIHRTYVLMLKQIGV